MIKVLMPSVPALEKIVPYLKTVHESNWFTNFGKLNEILEARLQVHFDWAYVVTVSSATAGLELAHAMMKNYGESEAAISAYTFPATALAAHRAGLKVVLRDVYPFNWTDGSVATFGVPVKADATPVLDAAAAFGEQKSLPGSMVVFSMHATKPLPAIEGGFIVTQNKDEANELRRMTNFGYMEATRTARYKRGHAAPMGFGTNAKLSEYHAAVALASLDEWPRTVEKYLRLYDWYTQHLPTEVVTQMRPRGVYPVLSIMLPTCRFLGAPPATIIGAYLADIGIETRRWYCPPIYNHPLFRADSTAFPMTCNLVMYGLGLPWHLHLTEDDVVTVCKGLREAMKNYDIE